MLLVRFDPSQGQTSVMSIPRDLLVNIKSSKGEYYPQEKINAAYTYGARLGGVKGSMELAAETIEKEVFPGLVINGIVDVNFASFIKIVDTLGCVYVNVDHRYLHINGEGGELYSEINLQPGYQKLCYNNALSYVRYRHGDSDFVRVARQQDFLRALREQVSSENLLKQLRHVAHVVGKAIVTAGFSASAERVLDLAKLIGFSQGKPLRQVKFRATSTNFPLKGGSYVTSTKGLEQATLRDFLSGDEKVAEPKPSPPHRSSHGAHGHKHAHHASAPSSASLGLASTPTSGDEELAKETIDMPLQVLYPSLQTAAAEAQPTRAYDLRDKGGRLRHAYVAVCKAEHARRLLRLRGHRLAQAAADRPSQPAAKNRAQDLHDVHRRQPHPRDRMAAGQDALLDHEHAARGSLQRTDARYRALSKALALDERRAPRGGRPRSPMCRAS